MRKTWTEIVDQSAGGRLVLVLFTGKTCAPCGRLKLDMAREVLPQEVVYEELDAWSDAQAATVASMQNIKQIPTLLLIKDHAIVHQKSGYTGAAGWREFLNVIKAKL